MLENNSGYFGFVNVLWCGLFIGDQDPDQHVQNDKSSWAAGGSSGSGVEHRLFFGSLPSQLCSQWEDHEQRILDSLVFFVPCAFIFLCGAMVDIYRENHFSLEVLNPILSSLTCGQSVSKEQGEGSGLLPASRQWKRLGENWEFVLPS